MTPLVGSQGTVFSLRSSCQYQLLLNLLQFCVVTPKKVELDQSPKSDCYCLIRSHDYIVSIARYLHGISHSTLLVRLDTLTSHRANMDHEFSYNLGADRMRRPGMRRRRTMSSSRAEGIVTAELRARKQQPDRPIHHPTDSLLSWTKQVIFSLVWFSYFVPGASGHQGPGELGGDASLSVRRQTGS